MEKCCGLQPDFNQPGRVSTQNIYFGLQYYDYKPSNFNPVKYIGLQPEQDWNWIESKKSNSYVWSIFEPKFNRVEEIELKFWVATLG